MATEMLEPTNSIIAPNKGNINCWTESQPTPKLTSKDSTEYLYKFVSIHGYTLPQNYKFLYVIYSIIVTSLGTFFLPIAFTLSYFQQTQWQIGPLLTSLQVVFDVYGGSTKIVIMGLMIQKLRSLDTIMEKLDFRCRDEEDFVDLQKLRKFGRNIVLIYFFTYFSYSTSTFLGSAVKGRPPYSLYLPYIDWRQTNLELIVASIIEYMLMNLAVNQQVVNDSYSVLYVSILRMHMKALLRRVQKLGSQKEWSSEKNFEELKLCIKDHKNMIELFNVIAPIISITTFVQFTITAIILGTTLINITIFTKEFSERVGSCFYLLAVFIQSFPICYSAQCLVNDSSRLAGVIFHSNWMDQDIRYRKMLIFFMHRAQSPMILSAAKVVPITLSSFLSIAKGSFTLYTFIQKMGIKERFGLE